LCVEDDVDAIAAEIMAYLDKRPMASDSLEGIANWWLMQQTIARNIGMVERALEQLAREGKIVKKVNSGKGAVYSLNPDGSKKSS